MKNKFKYFLIFTALLSLMVVTACAEEAISEPSEVVSEPSEVVSEPSEVVSESSGTGEEDIPFDSGSVSFFSDAPLVVDVSEQSVSAIADAVSSANDSIILTNKNGVQVKIGNHEFLKDYPYFAVLSDFASNYALVYSAEPFTYTFAGGTHYFYASQIGRLYFTPSDLKVGTSPSFSTYQRVTNYPIVYSNFDIPYFTSSQGVYYYSDLPKSFTVSFVTGIDGYEVEQQSFRDLVLPELSQEGLVFTGWYLDPDFEQLFTSSFNPTEDFTLYAKFVDEPPFGIIHQSIFEAFEVFLSCEPILYIMSLVGLVIFIGIGKSLVTSRL